MKADVDAVVAIGSTGTPASFFNGRYLLGAQPFESFQRLVDEEIAKARGATPSSATGTR